MIDNRADSLFNHNMNKKCAEKHISEIAKVIYDRLTLQRFAEWYSDDGDFGRHIIGDENCKTTEEILKQIEGWFK